MITIAGPVTSKVHTHNPQGATETSSLRKLQIDKGERKNLEPGLDSGRTRVRKTKSLRCKKTLTRWLAVQ